MGLRSNRISKEELQSGDHIYCYRAVHTYSHHGIYLKEGSNDRVIHYEKKNRRTCENCRGEQPAEEKKNQLGGVVVKSCLDCFLKGHGVLRYEYQASKSKLFFKKSGTCTTGSADEPGIVLQRAAEMLRTNGFGAYHLLSNNCETFAVYCKTGIRSSVQAISVEAAWTEFTKNPMSVKNAAISVGRVILERKLEVLKIDIKKHESTSRSSEDEA